MFKYKYKIHLKTKEVVSLFGEDYYNDKRVFNAMHSKQLADLYVKVLKCGFPIKIEDIQTNLKTQIKSKKDFDLWLNHNQPKFL